MTLFLAALVIAAPVADPPPVILIVSHAGNIIAWRSKDYDKFAHYGLEVAVWADGRIMWEKVEKKPSGRLHRQCYESTIASSRVTEVLETFRSRKVFQVRDINAGVPCGGGTDVVARQGADSLHWFYTGNPDLAYPGDASPKSWRKSVEAWNLVQREARALIPAKGRRIDSINFAPIELQRLFPTRVSAK